MRTGGDAMTKAIILLPLLLLAACDSGPTVTATNASVAEVAGKVDAVRRDIDFLRAGKWVTKGRIDELHVPGMPPELAAQMKESGREMPGTETCMTEADVRKPGPDFFTGNKSCRYDHFTMGGGKIDARMRCSAAGGTQLSTMTGTYGPDLYRMAMSTAMEMPSGAAGNGMEGMTMKLSVEGKRIGDCDAGTATKPAAQ
jgi:hypothetical protein